MTKFFTILAAATLASCVSSIKLPPQLEAQASLVEGSNNFAVDLYGEVSTEPGNVFISPVSISAAFGLLYPGTRGNTATEIADVMGYNLPTDADFASTMGGLLDALQADRDTSKLRIANAAWVREDAKLANEYRDTIKSRMRAEISSINFSMPEVARKAINDWVLAATNDHIDNLIPSGFIDPNDTYLVLTNAVWFKADWADQFQAAKTLTDAFTGRDGKVSSVRYLTDKRDVRYVDSGNFHAVELDYASDGFAMAFLLPKDVNGLSALEASLASGGVSRTLNSLSAAKPVLVDLKIPKVTTSVSYKLPEPLERLGLRQAFRKDANLSGLFDHGSFMVSDVVHKTFLEINEKGTEAAAATAIGVTLTSGQMSPPKFVEFHAKHPYLIVLRHKATGAILFIGRIEEPTPAE